MSTCMDTENDVTDGIDGRTPKDIHDFTNDDDTERNNVTTKLLNNNDNDVNDDVSEDITQHNRRRWLVLLAYSLNVIMGGQMYINLGPVNNIAHRYFNVSSTAIEWLSNVFILGTFFSIPATYIIGRLGIRHILNLCAVCNLIATLFHVLGYGPNGF